LSTNQENAPHLRRIFTSCLLTDIMRVDPTQLVADDQNEEQQDREADSESQCIHSAIAFALILHHKEQAGKQAGNDEQEGNGDQDFHGASLCN
jgi:hypothetical protein